MHPNRRLPLPKMQRPLLAAIFLLEIVLSHGTAVFAQGGDLSSGPTCLYTALVSLDVEPGPYAEFLQRVGGLEARGAALGRLAEVAEEFGLSTLAVQTSLDHLRLRQAGPPLACIAHIDGNHFVLIGEVQPKAVWIIDRSKESSVAIPVFQQRWQGRALLIARQPLTPEEDLRLPWGNWWLVGGMIAIVLLVLTGGVWAIRRRRPT